MSEQPRRDDDVSTQQPPGWAPPPAQDRPHPSQGSSSPGPGSAPYGGTEPRGPRRAEGADDLSPADQRLWSTLTHVAGVVAPVVAPLVAFLVLKDRGLFVRDQTREALNAHISYGLYFVGLYLFLGVLTLVTLGLASPLLGVPPLLWFLLLVVAVLAAVRSNRGERNRYPLVLRLVR